MLSSLKKSPLLRALVRFLRRPGETVDLLGSKNYRFISTFAPGHFYSPIPDDSDFEEEQKQSSENRVIEENGIKLNTEFQKELIGSFSRYYDEIPFEERSTKSCRFMLDNGLFSFGDPIILYSILRHFQPNKIVEVGSGYSSAAMLDINDIFFDRRIGMEFIEPYPDRLFGLLSEDDRKNSTVHIKRVQDVPLSVFSELSENDILFVDSSHVVKAGSDLLHIISNVLPRLNKGVLLHFHDIFWPFSYPKEWFDDGRAWNEAYFLKAFLQFNDAFEIVFYNAQMEAQFPDLLKSNLPNVLKRPSNFPYTRGNSSLWLRKVK